MQKDNLMRIKCGIVILVGLRWRISDVQKGERWGGGFCASGIIHFQPALSLTICWQWAKLQVTGGVTQTLNKRAWFNVEIGRGHSCHGSFQHGEYATSSRVALMKIRRATSSNGDSWNPALELIIISHASTNTRNAKASSTAENRKSLLLPLFVQVSISKSEKPLLKAETKLVENLSESADRSYSEKIVAGLIW